MPHAELMTTGEVARLAGVAAETVRLWERNGLLKAQRTAHGYRLFRRARVERLLARRAEKR